VIDKYPVKKYPIVGACGLDCGLCPRSHSDGKSKCTGCCGNGFWDVHPSCSFITCCVKQKGLETCAKCAEWQECIKYSQLLESAQGYDSFISYKPVSKNLTFIRKYGIAEFAKQATEKQELLKYILDNYDDGRSKLFFCTVCQLIPLPKMKEAVTTIKSKITEDSDIKKRAKIARATINKMADGLKIDLKLRK
jgi:hypothetical protein